MVFLSETGRNPNNSTMSFSLFIFIFSLYILSHLTTTALSLPTIGVTYTPAAAKTTTSGNTSDRYSSPSPNSVPALLQSIKIPSARLPEPDPSVVRAFLYTNISLLVTIPNNMIPVIAANRSGALKWLYRHVVPFYPRARISTISVGNDVIEISPDLSDYLLPAIRNVYYSLRELGIRKVSVSTTFSFINIMTTSFPPSAAEFQEPAVEVLIKPLLQFLEDTNSSFLINVYPYNLYRYNSEIPIGFALFQENSLSFRDDLTTGVRYRNLFDMMVDSVISAMAVAGHENIPVIVTETGWPSSGEASEIDANSVYAEMYLKGLLRHLKSGLGTPLRKEGASEIYIYELFDREAKPGGQIGRQWGMFYPNMTKKYNINFSGADRISSFGRGFMKIFGWFVLVISVLLFQ